MIPKAVTLVIPNTDITVRLGRVDQIRSIRSLTNLGLKEAKDISDTPGPHRVEVQLLVNGAAPLKEDTDLIYAQCKRDLVRCGVQVIEDSVTSTIEDLKKLITTATLREHYDLAQDLLEVAKKYMS